MKPKVWSYTICYNEARMLPWFLRHYETWCDRMIFFDDKSTDGSRDIIRSNPKAELRDWPYSTGLDDDRFRELWNSWYREACGQADWVLMPDCDEILLHPDPLRLLSETKADMVGSTGLALISKSGWPIDDGKSQIYDLVRYGTSQENYSKFIAYRPTVNVEHAHGRHTYAGRYPKCSGVIDPVPRFKLLHCHQLGGVEHVEERNRRNFQRANEKRFAWNMAEDIQSNKDQGGTVAWVQDLIDRDAMVDIVGDFRPKMSRKLNFGCGGLLKEGWENFDLDVDISKPLPFQDGCASFIHAEHVMEHVTPQQAWLFLEECKRVLKPGGVVRIAVPDLERMHANMTPAYAKAVKDGGHGDNPIRAAVFSHGHQGAWSEGLLWTVMEAIGFKATGFKVGESEHPELRGAEQHWKTVGKEIETVETACVEGVKP